MLDQSPTAGTRLRRGEFVTIFVGKFKSAADHHHANHDDAARSLMRVAVLSGGRSSEHQVSLRLRRLGGGGAAGRGPRGDPGPAGARRALDARRRGDRAAGRGRPARRRGRLPGAARPVRRGRHGAGPARVPGPPLCRPRRARRGGGDRQADLQAGARLPRHPPGGVLRGRRGGLARAGGGHGLAAVGEARAVGLERRDLEGDQPRTRAGRGGRAGPPPRPAGDRRGARGRQGGGVLGDRQRGARGPRRRARSSPTPTGTTTRPSTTRAAWT